MIIEVLSIIGVFVFATSGVLIGLEKKLDPFGLVTIAFFTASGGGIIRDVILGEIPSIFSSTNAIATIIVATYFGMRIYDHKKFHKLFLYFDAMGLALFVTLGTLMSYQHGLTTFGVVFLGTLSGIGGGIIRDILVNEIPLIFTTKDLYASISIVGILLFIFLMKFDFVSTNMALLIQAFFILVFRIVAIERNWHWHYES